MLKEGLLQMGGSIVGEAPSRGTVLGRALSGGAVLGGLSVFIKNLTGSVPLYSSVYNKLSADCARVRLCVRMYCTLHWGQSGLLQRYVPQTHFGQSSKKFLSLTRVTQITTPSESRF